MSKADSSPSTAAPASKSRRAVILGAGGIAAAGALAPMALASPLPSEASLEFREWYRVALTYPAVLREQETWEKAHPFADEEQEQTSPFNICCDTLKVYEDAIFARPVRSWSDVAEIAMIALFWLEKEDRPGDDRDDPYSWSLDHCDSGVDSEYRNVRSQARLIQAAAKVALQTFGGANV